MSNNNIKSDMGGGNPLNIIRIGGNTEYYNIILMNDLNGTITIPTLEVYTPVWNRRYSNGIPGEVTQWNITSTCKWFDCNWDFDKSSFPDNQGETYDANPGIRIIIEFKE